MKELSEQLEPHKINLYDSIADVSISKKPLNKMKMMKQIMMN